MAGRLMGRIPDGTEARRLLSRLLLGIDGSPVCLWRDEPVMGRLYQRLCPAREDRLRKPIAQPPWRSFVHWLGSMDCFWLVKLRHLGMPTPASRTAVRRRVSAAMHIQCRDSVGSHLPS